MDRSYVNNHSSIKGLIVQTFDFHQDTPDVDTTLAKCICHLASGKLVALPTETVYGLAGDATNGIAVARIFEVKQRPQFNPLIAHVSGLEMAKTIGKFDETSIRLAKAFWPGPLTLVVAKVPTTNIHDLVTAGLETIAIRCPGGSAHQLIAAYGSPLAAPSANRSGRLSPTSAKHVVAEFPGEDIIVLDGGDCDVGIESTIATVQNGEVVILRAGSVTIEQLADASGLEVTTVEANSKITAPGMLASHYAPRAEVVLECKSKLPDAAMLAIGPDCEGELNLSVSGDLKEAAANLYRQLRQLDGLGLATICVAPIPHEGLGIAINDRLSRAAAPRSTDGNANE